MSKTNEQVDKTKEAHAKETHAKDSQTSHAGEKKGEHKKAEAPVSSSRNKGHSPLPGGCAAWGCKAPEKRFNFCDEHYDQFKFGLIKKTGEQVSDHEKKLEHYLAYKAKRKVQKVA
jgi:hypothetical protein